jgi:hypothetical protein
MHTFPNINRKHASAVTWYPHSGLLAYNGHLYFVCLYDERTLLHAAYIEAKAHVMYDRKHAIAVWFPEIGNASNTGNVITNSYRKTLIIGTGNLVTDRPIRNIITNPDIWTRAQRWLRKVLQPKLEARRLAFAMGWHDRLGRNSVLSTVTADVANLCFHRK